MSKIHCKKPNFNVGSPIAYLLNHSYNGDSRAYKTLIKERLETANSLYSRDLFAHYGCVNAVEFSNDGEYLISGGDDKRVLLWNINKAMSYSYKPVVMKGEHHSNIFCLSFDAKHTRIFSAGNDEQVILHDTATGETSDVFIHDEAVYGLSVDPVNENLFASACEDGRVLIWDVRESTTDAATLANYSSGFHAVMYNPSEPRLLATANAKEGVGLWDIRKPRSAVMKYGTQYYSQGAMNVCFNKVGRCILALRRRLPPVLYEINSPRPSAEFDHPEYYNSCTMKSCCFAGENDQFVLSGSDDFKLYMWKVPDDVITKKCQWINEAHLTIRGHRSIVNQVRYNSTFGFFASSGVEKVIKLWSTFPFGTRLKASYFKNALRKVYSHEEYLNLVLESGQFMTHDYSHHSVQEDPRMMAFFDSLVQRDIEGWTSSDSSTDALSSLNTNYEVISPHSSSSSSLSSSSSSSDSDNEKKVTKNVRITDGDLKKFDDSNESTEEQSLKKDDLLSDKISLLIAKKRKRQLQNSYLNKNLHKRIKKSKGKPRKKKAKVDFFISTFGLPDLISESTQRILGQNSTSSNLNDKRKTLQKKRAKLLRLPDIFGHSSDSDVVDEVKKQSTDVCETSKNDLQQVTPTSNSMPQNGVNPEVNVTVPIITSVNDTKEHSKSDENVKKNNSETSNVPDSTTSEFNGDGTSTVHLDSNGSLFSSSKSKKRHSRNYRKRSAEDV